MVLRPPPTGAGASDRLSVVVVDDDARWREHAAEPFKERGDEVRTYADGLEALAACVKRPPDVILTDVQMPRMDGWQLLRTIRANPVLRAVPVVFLTALSGEAERLKGHQLGVDGYVPKPFQPLELLVRVRQIVRHARIAPASAAKQALRGDLENVAPASLLSFISVEKKTGVLLLVGDQVVRAFFREGRPVRAEIEGAVPRPGSRAVLMQVLDWKSGQFEFGDEEVTHRDELHWDVNRLILEHARLKDERRR